jgi:hypothetical protein
MTQDGKTLVLGGKVVVCQICVAYARLRGPRIRDEIHRTVRPADRYDTWVRFMAGVHQRHLRPGRPAVRNTTSKETR